MPWFGLRTAEMKDQEYNADSQVVQWFKESALVTLGNTGWILVLEDPTHGSSN